MTNKTESERALKEKKLQEFLESIPEKKLQEIDLFHI